MKGKYKATGCARFFIALLILAPLAYIGASYYNGQNGLENVKRLIGWDGSKEEVDRSDVADLQKQLQELKRENRDLSQKLADCQEEQSNL